MNSDDPNPIDAEIRSAYEELSERAAVAARSVSTSDASPSARPVDRLLTGQGFAPPAGQRFAPALVVAAAVAFLAGGATLFALRGDDDQPVETGPAENEQTATDDKDLDGEPLPGQASSGSDDEATGSDSSLADPTISDQPDDRVDGEVRVGDRYRVATALVAADVNDPFLNLRWSPDADAELLSRLPPTYAGLEATGMSSEAADGGTWLEFELLDPVQVNLGEPLDGGAPTGWANAAFVERLPSGLPIGTDELAACGGEGSSFEEPDRSGAATDDWHVYGLESRLMSDRCLRVVVTFGQGSESLGTWETFDDRVGPATAIPAVQITSKGGFGVTVDLPGVNSAFSGATEAGDSAFVVRRADESLELISPLPVRGAQLVAFPERGIVVVDLELDTDRGAPLSGSGVYLTREPMVGNGRIDLAGIARPFEASVGIRVLDESGTAVEAVFSGTRFLGTIRATSYAASTNDWTEAWGSFALRVADLPPGSYSIEFDSEFDGGGLGGGDESSQRFLVPFTISWQGSGDAETGSASAPTLATDEEQSAALRLMAYAEYGDIEAVPLADEVTLLLGGAGGEQQVRSRGELGSREAWTFDAEEAFAFVGPFNILDQLRPIGAQISAGPINHCAGPPVSWPASVSGLRQVNIEPVGIDSCLSWFGVSLFLDADGDIAAVALDRWEP